MAGSTASMSTGVTAKNVPTMSDWTSGQHLTTLDCCPTQTKLSVSPLTDGTSASTRNWPSRVSVRTTDCRTDVFVLGAFPRSQHRPSLIMPPRLKVPAHSDPVKRWNFRKADWNHFCPLTGESVQRLLPPDATNVEKAYQDVWEPAICY